MVCFKHFFINIIAIEITWNNIYIISFIYIFLEISRNLKSNYIKIKTFLVLVLFFLILFFGYKIILYIQ